MNLLFICSRLPYPPNRGDSIRVFHFQKYLSELGVKITVLSPCYDKKERQIIEYYKKEIPVSLYTSIQKNIYPKYLKGLLKGQTLTLSHFFNEKISNQFKHYLKEQFYDAIICTNCVNAEYIIQNKKLIDEHTKVIIDHMDLDSDKWQQYANRSSAIKKWIYLRESKLIRNLEKEIPFVSDFSLFTSKKEVELYKPFTPSPNKLKVISNGIDTKYFTTPPKSLNSKQTTFLFTGVMDYFPNEQAVIWFVEDVWPKVLQFLPEAKFYIAGMNPTKKVKRLSKVKGVYVTGFVDDIRVYYEMSDIYVAPLKIARGIQNKILEAFASNKPVISTSNSIQGIECIENEHVLIAETSEEFINQIKSLLKSKRLRENLMANAQSLIREKYSWKAQTQKLYDLIAN